MKTGITAIGTANPQYQRNQDEVSKVICSVSNLTGMRKKVLEKIFKATGIKKRYSVLSDFSKNLGEFTFFPNDLNSNFPSTAKRMELYKINALNLVLMAIDDCFKQLDDFNKNDITHLITVSCTGMYAPGIDIEIVQQLELNTHVQRTAINFMGCYGAFNAIKAANAFCHSDPKAKVLVVCVELCTIHFQKPEDLANIISNAIFSDGAGALIIESNPERKKWLSLETFLCDLLPQSTQEMAWKIGDQGFDMILSSYVPDLIKSGINAFATKLLDKLKLTISDIHFFGIHPGGPKILEASEAALNISKHDNRFSYEVMENYGNMSSATIVFVLKELWNKLQLSDGEKRIFSCAFGPGLTLESLLLQVKINAV